MHMSVTHSQSMRLAVATNQSVDGKYFDSMTLSKGSDAPEQADKQTERQTDLEIVALKSGASSLISFFLAAAAAGNGNGNLLLKPNSHIPPDLHLLARVRGVSCEV